VFITARTAIICLGNNGYFKHTNYLISKTKEIIATKQKALYKVLFLTEELSYDRVLRVMD